jgi:hypothetical protein
VYHSKKGNGVFLGRVKDETVEIVDVVRWAGKVE